MSDDELVALVKELTQEILEGEGKPVPSLDTETRLFAKDGLLDSMGIISLVVALEQAIEDRSGISVSLADQRALSQSRGPYRTIGAVAEYAGVVLNETR